MLKKVVNKVFVDNKEKIVCSCFKVTKNQIKEAVNNGCTTISELRKETKAGMGCGKCNAKIERVLYKELKNKNISK